MQSNLLIYTYFSIRSVISGCCRFSIANVVRTRPMFTLLPITMLLREREEKKSNAIQFCHADGRRFGSLKHLRTKYLCTHTYIHKHIWIIVNEYLCAAKKGMSKLINHLPIHIWMAHSAPLNGGQFLGATTHLNSNHGTWMAGHGQRRPTTHTESYSTCWLTIDQRPKCINVWMRVTKFTFTIANESNWNRTKHECE